MGEILAVQEQLANEYAYILASFIEEDEVCWGNDVMLAGALWGLGRLAQVRPLLLKEHTRTFEPFLRNANATLRGTATWALAQIGSDLPPALAEALRADQAEFPLYLGGHLTPRRVCDVASSAAPVAGTTHVSGGAGS